MMQQTPRPRIRPSLNLFDHALEVAGWIGLLGLWTFAAVSYAQMPDVVPIHFSSNGTPNNWGSKATVFLLPGIATAMVAGLTLLNRYPHIFNYPVLITPENAARQYTIATRLLRWVKAALPLLFTSILWQIARAAQGRHTRWAIPLILLEAGAVVIPIAIALVSASRNARPKP